MTPCALTDTLYLKQTFPNKLLEKKNQIAANEKPVLIAPLYSIVMDFSQKDPPFRALYPPHQTTKLHHLQEDDADLFILHSSVCTTTTEIIFHFKYMYTF